MRSDPSKNRKFSSSSQWQVRNDSPNLLVPRDENDPSLGFVANSFSGHERNRLFLQTEGNFDDVSLVSGVDYREDCRGFALLDYNLDGFLDIGIVSPQEPRFRLLRNRLCDLQSVKNNFVYIQLVGGNESNQPTLEWSSREAYGAILRAFIGSKQQAYQASCGEGFASQNSRWIHVGMGTADAIDRLEVRWPSGKQATYQNILANKRIIIREKSPGEFQLVERQQ